METGWGRSEIFALGGESVGDLRSEIIIGGVDNKPQGMLVGSVRRVQA